MKLLLSAFALSLCLSLGNALAQIEGVDEFMGLETEILPKLDEKWTVEEKAVEVDKEPLKGQGHSLIPWKSMEPESFLSIENWMLERSYKDKNPDWKFRLRDERQLELAGKVLQCRGTCFVARGTSTVAVQHLSRLVEGDEIRTDQDSIAWVYLMDGTLLRLAAQSSVSIQEINFSPSEVFYLVRLNQGHVFWHPRSTQEFAVDASPETDAVSLPLMVREANLAHFERELFKQQADPKRLGEIMGLGEGAFKSQVTKLNELIKKNNIALDVRVMMVAPNVTLTGKNASFDLLHYPGGKSYFKQRSWKEKDALSLQLRGYNVSEVQAVTSKEWHEVDNQGRSFSPLNDIPGPLAVTELLTKRIATLELAREIWIETFTLPVLRDIKSPRDLAVHHGYALWDESLEKRATFLAEYTRRIETSNLKSIENLVRKLKERGESPVVELSDDHYRRALSHYLRDLKLRYTDWKMQVREMSDVQYYVWILRHGKY